MAQFPVIAATAEGDSLMPKLAAFPKAWMQGCASTARCPSSAGSRWRASSTSTGSSSTAASRPARALRVAALPAPRRGPGTPHPDALLLSRLHAPGPGVPARTGGEGEGLDRHGRGPGLRHVPGPLRPAPPELTGTRGSASPWRASSLPAPRRGRRDHARHREPLQGRLLAVPGVRPGHGRLLRARRPDRLPHFGVNYDPATPLLAGEDPLELCAACASVS